MSRYQKFYSNYILSRKHKLTSVGTIWERDWSTLGERHTFEPGKRPFYGDSNFIFTENAVKPYTTKSKSGKWVAHLTYDDIDGSALKVNSVKLDTYSDVFTDYAYYGSAVELIRSSVENIIREFPGNVSVGNEHYTIFNNETRSYEPYKGYYTLSNPFNIDFVTTNPSFADYDNELRYLGYSFMNYVIVSSQKKYETEDVCPDSDCESSIVSYEVKALNDNPYGFDETMVLNGDVFGRIGNRVYRFDKTYGRFTLVKTYNDKDYFCLENCGECGFVENSDDESYVCESSGDDGNPMDDPKGMCIKENDELYTIEITTDDSCGEGPDYILHGLYTTKRGIVWVSERSDFIIQPKKEVIDEYFESLSGFEKRLLNLDSNPVYRNTFQVPYEDGSGFVRMRNEEYTWPSVGYCIDITSTTYSTFIGSLVEAATRYDEYWCDNIYRNMTHESIKNFDWTFSRHYNEGEEVENIIGGEQMARILRLYGRFFDDLRQYINGISNSATISYDGYNNTTTAEISDKCELHGFEMYSTIWQPYEYEEVDSDDIPEGIKPVRLLTLPKPVDSESPDYVCLSCPETECGDGSSEDSSGSGETHATCYKKITNDPNAIKLDCDFINGFVGDSENISKECPWITESFTGYYYKQSATPYPGASYDESVTFSTIPEYCTSETPWDIKVVDNGKRYYFHKTPVNDDNCSKYIHDKWYGALSYGKMSPVEADIEFARRLYLSGAEILRTKGTKHSIDMVMGIFGFGEGDYECFETYRATNPKDADSTYYFYRYSETEEIDSHSADYLEFLSLPNANEVSPVYVKVGEIYYTKDTRQNIVEAIIEANEHKTTEKTEENEFSGIPVGLLELTDNKRYIIPYYNSKSRYDGDFVFQSFGGWGKRGINGNNYTETMSYLRVVSGIDEMLRTNPMSTRDGDICYVSNLSSFADYYGAANQYVSHYFKLIESSSPYLASSWENVPVTGPITYPNYVPVEGTTATHADYLNVMRVSSIINVCEGNNPHVGYGDYDDGEGFFEYMSFPFKNPVENFAFDNDESVNIAKSVRFGISGKITDNDKVKILTDKFVYVLSDEPKGYEFDDLNSVDITDSSDASALAFYNKLFSNLSSSSPSYIMVLTDEGVKYYRKTVIPSETQYDRYYLNSKVLVIKNNLYNRYYNGYFIDVISKYLTQVIPSTTILVLDGFDTVSESAETVKVTISKCEECTGDGIFHGDGVYIRCSDVTLTAEPYDGDRFVKWMYNGKTSYDQVLVIHKLTSDLNVEVCFEEACVIELEKEEGCEIVISNISGNVEGINEGPCDLSKLTLYGDGSFTIGYNITDAEKYEFSGWDINGEVYDKDNISVDLSTKELCGSHIVLKTGIREYELSLGIESECGDDQMLLEQFENNHWFPKPIITVPNKQTFNYGDIVRLSVYDKSDCCETPTWKINGEIEPNSIYDKYKFTINGDAEIVAVSERKVETITVVFSHASSEHGHYVVDNVDYSRGNVFDVDCGNAFQLSVVPDKCYKTVSTVSVYGMEPVVYENETVVLDNVDNDVSIEVDIVCDCEDATFTVDKLYARNKNPNLNNNYVDITEYGNLNNYEDAVGYEGRENFVCFKSEKENRYYDLTEAGNVVIEDEGTLYANGKYNPGCNGNDEGCECGKVSTINVEPKSCEFEFVGIIDNENGLWIEYDGSDCCETSYGYILNGNPKEADCRAICADETKWATVLPVANENSPNDICLIEELDPEVGPIYKGCYKKISWISPSCHINYLPLEMDGQVMEAIFEKYGTVYEDITRVPESDFDEMSHFESCPVITDENRFVIVTNENGNESLYQLVVSCDECKACLQCGHKYSVVFVYNMAYEIREDDFSNFETYTLAANRDDVPYESIDSYLTDNPYNADSPDKLVVATIGLNPEGEGYEYYILKKPYCCDRKLYISAKSEEDVTFTYNGGSISLDILGSGDDVRGTGEGDAHHYIVYDLPCDKQLTVHYNDATQVAWCECGNIDSFKGNTGFAADCPNGCSGITALAANNQYTIQEGEDDVFIRVNVD